ncbi:MAG: hypothetical protein ACFCBW_03370 [Candidatus Competibacterales bacterium]
MRTLHCLLYSHPWVVHCLEQGGFDALDDAVLVELGTPTLAAVLGASLGDRPGITALLQGSVDLATLAEDTRGLPAPVIFAPQPALPVSLLSAATGLLATASGPFDRAILLVNVIEVPSLVAALAPVDDFSCLWDLADPPSNALPKALEALAQTGHLQTDQWCGLRDYSHPQRQVSDLNARRYAFHHALAIYPVLAGVSA